MPGELEFIERGPPTAAVEATLVQAAVASLKLDEASERLLNGPHQEPGSANLSLPVTSSLAQVQASNAMQKELMQSFTEMQNSIQGQLGNLTDLVNSLQTSMLETQKTGGGRANISEMPESPLKTVAADSSTGTNADIALVVESFERLLSKQAEQFDEVLNQKMSAQTGRMEMCIARLGKDRPDYPMIPELKLQNLEADMPVIKARPEIPELKLQNLNQNPEEQQLVSLEVQAQPLAVAIPEEAQIVLQSPIPDGTGSEEFIKKVSGGEGEPINKSDGSSEKPPISRGCSSSYTAGLDHLDTVADHHDLLKDSGICIKIFDSTSFKTLSLCMICFNATYIGVEQDWNESDSLLDSDIGWQICEQLFCTFFVVELLVHFGAFKRKRDCTKDRWFVLDIFLVILIVLETWVFTLLAAVVSNPPNTGSIGGIGRMLRLLRLARISKLMETVPELVTMVKSMAAAIRAVHAALLILSLLVYVFAILMNDLLGEEPGLQKYFLTVRGSMVSLLVHGVLLDDISGLTRAIIESSNMLALLFLALFCLLSAVTVMNMLIGVLCEVVLEVSAQEKETHVKLQMQKTLLVMLKDLDEDNSGELSKDELQSVFLNPSAVAVMNEIQVDTQHLMTLTEMLYENEDSTLSIPIIMNIVLSLRGGRPPTMNDLAKTGNFILWALETQLAQHRELMAQRLALQSGGGGGGGSSNAPSSQEMSSKIEGLMQSMANYHSTLQDHHDTLKVHHQWAVDASGHVGLVH